MMMRGGDSGGACPPQAPGELRHSSPRYLCALPTRVGTWSYLEPSRCLRWQHVSVRTDVSEVAHVARSWCCHIDVRVPKEAQAEAAPVWASRGLLLIMVKSGHGNLQSVTEGCI